MKPLIKTHLLRGLLTGLLALATVLPSASADVGVITLPAGLNPGDPYRLIFVTSAGMDATAGTFVPYDAFAAASAAASVELNALATTWRALLSVPTSQPLPGAREHTETSPTTSFPNNIPIYNLQGQLVAVDYADLWNGSIGNAIRYDEFGASVTTPVWTGTATNGFGIASRQVSNSLVQVGDPMATNNTWIGFNGGTVLDSSEVHSIYAVSNTIIAVPEPSSALLLAGSGMLLALRRRRAASL